jgi:biotin carboxylase
MSRIAIVEGPTYLSDLIGAAALLGFKIVLVRGLPGTLYRGPELSDKIMGLVDYSTDCDVASDEALKSCIIAVSERFPIEGIIGIHELVIERVARMASFFGFPFCSSAALELARDKFQLRQKMFNLGLSPNPSVRVSDAVTLGNAFLQVGWPCVLKPRRGTGSFSVFVFQEPKNANEAWENAVKSVSHWPSEINDIASTDFVVERYLQGPLLSLEVAVAQGLSRLIAVCWRFRASHDETLEIGSLMPVPCSEKLSDDLEKFANSVVSTAGLDRGICHIEAILTESGPQLVEMNPRLMGGSLPLLFERSYRTNIFKFLIPLYLENSFRSELPLAISHSLSCFFGAFESGVMPAHIHVNFLRQFFAYQPELKFFVPPGDSYEKLHSNYSYLGRFILTGPDVGELFQVRDQILDMLESELGFAITRPEKGLGLG